MTSIEVQSKDYQVENRSWQLSKTGTGHGEKLNVVLKMSLFTAAGLAPNGYVPSGMDVGIITAETTTAVTVVGPYDNAATDGRQTCAGLLESLVQVPKSGGDAAGAVQRFGVVSKRNLPRTIDAAGIADLPNIDFRA